MNGYQLREEVESDPNELDNANNFGPGNDVKFLAHASVPRVKLIDFSMLH